MLEAKEFDSRFAVLLTQFAKAADIKKGSANQHKAYRDLIHDCLELQADCSPFDSIEAICQLAQGCQLCISAWVAHGSPQRAYDYMVQLCKIWRSALVLNFIDSSCAPLALSHFEFLHAMMSEHMDWVSDDTKANFIWHEVFSFFEKSVDKFHGFSLDIKKMRDKISVPWTQLLRKISIDQVSEEAGVAREEVPFGRGKTYEQIHECEASTDVEFVDVFELPLPVREPTGPRSRRRNAATHDKNADATMKLPPLNVPGCRRNAATHDKNADATMKLPPLNVSGCRLLRRRSEVESGPVALPQLRALNLIK